MARQDFAVQPYYRWREGSGGMKLDQARGVREKERENTNLKRLMREPSVEMQIEKWWVEYNTKRPYSGLDYSPPARSGRSRRRVNPSSPLMAVISKLYHFPWTSYSARPHI
jgi:hypothetical protein